MLIYNIKNIYGINKMNISLISDICGIAGFLLSLFAIGSVIKINKRINSYSVKINNTDIGGDFIGRDKKTK